MVSQRVEHRLLNFAFDGSRDLHHLQVCALREVVAKVYLLLVTSRAALHVWAALAG